ncbi:MAG: hypothetical protein ACRD2L_02700 [Terriglobia bacterium]
MSNQDTSLAVLREQEVRKHESILEALDRHQVLLQKVIDEMPKGSVVRVSVDEESVNLGVTGDKHTLLAAVRRLRANGFSHRDSPPRENAPEWYAYFRHAAGAKIFFRFTSTSCRRVKVGTKMVEQDVFETVCGEIVFDGDQPNAASS